MQYVRVLSLSIRNLTKVINKVSNNSFDMMSKKSSYYTAEIATEVYLSIPGPFRSNRIT